ncbi:hypothetical protein I7I50_11586 [Histoplasma capsulatum G186AR]|uniref:Uncharacterized protein n=1 Tax=Ajellomyces capsulatus TaxID=5037 RepID=A0A8H7Z5G1_AJECA|nr:hypothetical protein I7I52_02823 [Histoplasma capsulatum]QSS70078.1 hypothetical protein I7I50_11586 [Histoplasma capsulatum G186AR]
MPVVLTHEKKKSGLRTPRSIQDLIFLTKSFKLPAGRMGRTSSETTLDFSLLIAILWDLPIKSPWSSNILARASIGSPNPTLSWIMNVADALVTLHPTEV